VVKKLDVIKIYEIAESGNTGGLFRVNSPRNKMSTYEQIKTVNEFMPTLIFPRNFRPEVTVLVSKENETVQSFSVNYTTGISLRVFEWIRTRTRGGTARESSASTNAHFYGLAGPEKVLFIRADTFNGKLAIQSCYRCEPSQQLILILL